MVILDSHIEGAQMYSPRQRADIYRAVIEYGYYGMEPDWLKGEALGFFIAIKPTLDTKKARSEAGRKSGESRRTKAEQTTNKSRTKAEQTDEQNANEVEEEVEVNKKDTLTGVQRSPRFKAPGEGEVSAYAAEIGCPDFDAAKFVDHYKSNGWKVGGKSPMKDWRAAVRNWIRRDGGSEQGKAVGKYAKYD